MQNLQRRIGSKYNILDKKRVIIKEGPLRTFSSFLGSVIKVYMILVRIWTLKFRFD